MLTGLTQVFPSFNAKLEALYNAAKASNTWGSSHYGMTNYEEYWAEAVQGFFDANAPDTVAPTTRDQLRVKDPDMYDFLVHYLGNNPWKSTFCPKWG